MPTKQIVQTPELLKILQDAGIGVSASNLSRFINTYNLTKAPSIMKQDYDTRVGGDGKTYRYPRPPREVTSGIYFKPTAAELKDLKNQYDKNILKKTDMGPGKVAFDKRNKRAIELLKSGKYSLVEAERILINEFPEVKGMKSTLQNLKKNIKGVPSGTTGSTATVVKRVTSAVNKLNKSNVKTLIENGEKNSSTRTTRL